MLGHLSAHPVCPSSARARPWVWSEGCRLSLHWLASRTLGCRVVVKEEGGVSAGKRGAGIPAGRASRFCSGNRCWTEQQGQSRGATLLPPAGCLWLPSTRIDRESPGQTQRGAWSRCSPESQREPPPLHRLLTPHDARRPGLHCPSWKGRRHTCQQV